MRALQTICFDLDDTLCDETGAWRECAAGTAAFAAARCPALDARAVTAFFLDHSEVFWRSMDPIRETRSVVEIRAAHWRVTLHHFGVNDPALPEDLGRHYGWLRAARLALFPDALPLLSALRQAGKTLVLITNGMQETHLGRIARLGLEAHFDHVLISDAVGFAKPDPRIFRHALELASCAPESAAMVGDNPANDIAGAQAVGLTAFWYNPHDRPLPPDLPAPRGGTVRALADLHPLLLA